MYQELLTVSTTGRGFYDMTSDIQNLVRQSGVEQGLCHVFVQHTSASVIVCENADPSVRQDVEYFFSRLVTDGDVNFRHRSEGEDDMAAHLRTLLTQTSIHLPVTRGVLNLGTWQGVYLYEHRYRAHNRKILGTVYG